MSISEVMREDPVGNIAYIFGGSVAIGLKRFFNEAETYSNQKSLTESKVKNLLGGSLESDKNKMASYLKEASEVNERKWQIINGVIELIPIIGPLILMAISHFAGTLTDQRDGDKRAVSNQAIEKSGVSTNYCRDATTLTKLEELRNKDRKTPYQYWSGRLQYNAPSLNH